MKIKKSIVTIVSAALVLSATVPVAMALSTGESPTGEFVKPSK